MLLRHRRVNKYPALFQQITDFTGLQLEKWIKPSDNNTSTRQYCETKTRLDPFFIPSAKLTSSPRSVLSKAVSGLIFIF
jgi:hypothetical protein